MWTANKEKKLEACLQANKFLSLSRSCGAEWEKC